MSDIKEIAVKYHKAGYNCAQSVLCACGEYTGVDEKTALALSAGLGGGLRSGEICGAISGAVIALGMAFPFADAADTESKNKIAVLAKECVSRGREAFGAVRCAELKGKAISCEALIAEMAAIAEDLIKNNK